MKKNTVSAFLMLSLGLAGLTASAQSTPELRAKIVSHYDKAKVDSLIKELKEKSEKSYKRALELADANGWPLQYRLKDGRLTVLTGVTENDEPIYKANDNNIGPTSGAITSRAAAIRTGGVAGLDLNGQGMTVGMWELGGPLSNHEQLVGRVTSADGVSFSSANEDALESSQHASHVAGTLIGSGNGDIGARGMAYEATLRAYDINFDDAEALSAATNVNVGLLISNHSYGVPVANLPSSQMWWRGAYIDEAYDWDDVMYNAPYYQAVISAGNDNNDPVGNIQNDLLVGNKNSKNAIIVAAIDGIDYSLTNSPGSVNIASFSSYGPTDDNRVKPDIAMKGTSVYSIYPTGSSDTDGYGYNQGTSMASPGVAGSLLLLQQHYHDIYDEYMRAATLKAIMINSADEAGNTPGPDQKFGWGVINVERAADIITRSNNELIPNKSIIAQETLNEGETYTRDITVTGDKPLKVTVVWTDYPGVEATSATTSNPVLKCDLDLRVQAAGSLFPEMPWRLNTVTQAGAIRSDNDRDNVEYVQINTPTPGDYTITVFGKTGTTFQNGVQAFSLIVNEVTDELNTNDVEYNNISIFPNPASDIINIKPGSAVQGAEGSVIMYDLQGRVVRQFNSLVDKVDVSSLTSGMYILNIEYDGYTESKKIMVK